MIVGISPDRFSSVWGNIRPGLEKALRRVDYPNPMEDVEAQLQDSRMQLWMTHDGKMSWITQILVYPRYKTFSVVVASGEGLDEWLAESDHLFTAFASHHGCKYVEVQGRRGWTKVGEPYGYAPVYTVLRKEV